MKMMKRIGIVLAILTVFVSTFALGAYANKLDYLTFDKGDASLNEVEENMKKINGLLGTINSEKEQALDKIDNLEEDIDKLNGDKQAKENKINELKDEVEAKEDEISELEKAQKETNKNHQNEIKELNKIAEKYGKTPAQVVLRWSLQHGFLPLPKTSTFERVKENADVFDFELTSEDMEKINQFEGKAGRMENPDEKPW